ncbi:MAG: leucyl aminopeptidase family protein [Xanthomonadales bacterium]|nr:leucyl aminopeptidase family protein [Xanthomonadales bacterium]NIX12265.1 leucyl aminopeptidase family protein [Xanthomonadales bacterium]
MSFTREHDQNAIPLLPVLESELDEWLENTSEHHRRWIESVGFKAGAGKWLGLPDADGKLEAVVFGMAEDGWLYQLAGLPGVLPPGNYRLVSIWNEDQRIQASIGWGLAAYRFERYRSSDKPRPVLCLEDDIAETVELIFGAQSMVRDLVNTPTEDMGPGDLADAVVTVGNRCDAKTEVIRGEGLLTRDFPAVHAVGRAADRAPRFVSLTWGDKDHPLLALVGKGVCFDTGGLDLKPAAGMLLMKKDMGGAAHVLALAQLVMQYELPVRLMLLIPAVENSISGNAYRPGDVVSTRKGLTVEIGNTDAEGRVILADALAYACEHDPDLVIDFATLTGAARVALGADLPPVFSNHLEIAQSIAEAGERVEDPLWVMPLHQPYNKLLKSEIADLNNISKGSYGGCITAALFLEHFVEPEMPWVHIDTFAWNQSSRPGRPVGGEALGLRAVFNYLRERYE